MFLQSSGEVSYRYILISTNQNTIKGCSIFYEERYCNAKEKKIACEQIYFF